MKKYIIVVISVLFLLSAQIVFAGETNKDKPIFVDIFLSADHKDNFKIIRDQFAAHSIHKVKAQFFRQGNPPTNIAIGGQIHAEVARLVIDLAIKYNKGVTMLMPAFRFFPNQIAIGTSAFDESVPVAISPEDLERLKDPSLSTPEFHKLYKTLTHEKMK